MAEFQADITTEHNITYDNYVHVIFLWVKIKIVNGMSLCIHKAKLYSVDAIVLVPIASEEVHAVLQPQKFYSFKFTPGMPCIYKLWFIWHYCHDSLSIINVVLTSSMFNMQLGRQWKTQTPLVICHKIHTIIVQNIMLSSWKLKSVVSYYQLPKELCLCASSWW